jgi:hypothetical protein
LLDKIVDKLPKLHRDKFPILKILDFNSGQYIGEKICLKREQVKQLNKEFNSILEILNKRHFLENVDANNLTSFLCNEHHPPLTKTELTNELNEMNELIEFAASNDCIIYINR